MGECPDQVCREKLIAATARAETIDKEHARQLSGIFDKLDGIHTSIDQNTVRAEQRDRAVARIDKCVTEINRKIENGMRLEMQEMGGQIKNILGIVDQRKGEREEEDRSGLWGFLRPGWNEFKHKASFIVVTAVIIGTAYTFVWGVSRWTIYKEGPASVMKFFGLG